MTSTTSKLQDEVHVSLLRQIFEHLDVDKSNTVDIDELKRLMRSLGLHLTQRDLESVVETYGLNKTLDFVQFAKFIADSLGTVI
jgi:Ca2+-binding EF-hand superfamily protein